MLGSVPYGAEDGLANLAAQMAYGESPLGPKLEVPTAYRDWRDQREFRFIGSRRRDAPWAKEQAGE